MLSKVSTELPDVPYEPETPWVLSYRTIQRLVPPPVASYSTRVEKVEKDAEPHTWSLTLQVFDAVVLATGPYPSAHVPDIEGIVDWSEAKKAETMVCITQSYRHPERYAGKAPRFLLLCARHQSIRAIASSRAFFKFSDLQYLMQCGEVAQSLQIC
ncbi:hypothetical protein C8R45DRAFT_1112574 [Mycena sanguinolenta]|nr:hypothetical protein C8R45DRAFT_1112574 [Mycena sanguinolenta]